MELDPLVRDVVGRADGGGAGVVVVELPRRERAVAARAALDVDDARGPEVGPRELLLARPRHLDGLAGRLREARGLERGVARVLAAVAGAGVGHDDAHLVARDVERVGQLVAHRERALRAGPHGELVAGPLGDRRPRLERHVRDVLDGVRPLELDVGGRHCFVDGADGARRPALAAHGVLPEEREERLVRGLTGNFVPRRLDRRGRARGGLAIRRGDAEKIAVADDGDARQLLGRVLVDGGERGLERRPAQDEAVEEAGAREVGGIDVPAGDEVAPVRFRHGRARDLPFGGRRERDVGRGGLHEVLALRQLAVRERSAGLGVADAAGFRREP